MAHVSLKLVIGILLALLGVFIAIDVYLLKTRTTPNTALRDVASAVPRTEQQPLSDTQIQAALSVSNSTSTEEPQAHSDASSTEMTAPNEPPKQKGLTDDEIRMMLNAH